MVRLPLIAALVASTAAHAFAAPAGAAPDWRAGGGDLFIDREFAPSSDARLPSRDQPYAEAISAAADRHGLEPKLLHALVLVESGYRADAVSRVGAAGLTQLMPATAAHLGVADRFDPAANLEGGATYLAQQLVRFGDLRLALAAYNAGPERVARAGRIPDIRETQLYVETVIRCFLTLVAGRSVTSARACSVETTS